MNLIVSVTQNWGIGCENELLYHVSKDLVRFRKMTTSKVVVMGHNTLKSLPGGKPLKNRTNIVLSRDTSLTIPGVVVYNSIDQLLAALKNYDTNDVFVIGGEAIYTALLPYCKKAYITKFQATPAADTFLPNIDEMPDWKLVDESEEHEHEGLVYRYCVYEK